MTRARCTDSRHPLIRTGEMGSVLIFVLFILQHWRENEAGVLPRILQIRVNQQQTKLTQTDALNARVPTHEWQRAISPVQIVF